MSDQAMQKAGGDGAMTDAATQIDGVEKALLKNDLSQLSPDERKDYYARVCESTGLNPLTQPLEYIYLNGDLTLYANKTAANQLRMEYDISITKIEEEQKWGLHIVQAYASTPEGRTDVDEGSVSVKGLSGEALANARMKAITKAKRRVTLSICGLGFLDRTEVADIRDDAKEATVVDHQTGEIKGKGSQNESEDDEPNYNGRLRQIDRWLESRPDEELAEALRTVSDRTEDWPDDYMQRVKAVTLPYAAQDQILQRGYEEEEEVKDWVHKQAADLSGEDRQRALDAVESKANELRPDQAEEAVEAMMEGNTALGEDEGEEESQ